MRVVVCHVHVPGSDRSTEYLYRFFTTWTKYPPGADHTVVVVCNGGEFDPANRVFLDPKWYLFPHSNDGKDIGAYIALAQMSRPEFLVCLGESCFFHRAGWLKRLIDARQRHGPGMYGVFSSNLVRPHLNTTAFACDPIFLRGYPELVKTTRDRYNFEHGNFCFWRYVQKMGHTVKLVTWDGEYSPAEWRVPASCFWRGDQSNCLLWCHHSERYRNASKEIKERWSRGADARFSG